ncbi:MAG: CPBP family intramembrane metalloprotease [Tenacibaculum sp.]|nr:CPBP family intramembrane metalloprotease [Tenacibaculum sp.]
MILNNFKKLSLVIQIIVLCLLTLFISETISIIFEYFYGEEVFDRNIKELPFLLVFFKSVIIAPLFETFVNQFAIIELSRKLFHGKKYMNLFSITISALIFGGLHFFNIAYILGMTCLGFWWASIYVFYKDHKNIFFPFLIVFLNHLINNLVAVITQYNFQNI